MLGVGLWRSFVGGSGTHPWWWVLAALGRVVTTTWSEHRVGHGHGQVSERGRIGDRGSEAL
jgi:hypothetical protein